MKDFTIKTPCNNCPYRKDAPLRHWDAQEFIDLLAKEKEYLGVVYACHKKNGHTCVGWLMNQDERNFPSIALRLSLSKNGVTRKYLDNLACKSQRFKTVQEMCRANYPEIFNK
jgi:hypothetical protein